MEFIFHRRYEGRFRWHIPKTDFQRECHILHLGNWDAIALRKRRAL